MNEIQRLRELLRQILPYAEQQIMAELNDGGVGMGPDLELLRQVSEAVKDDPLDDFEAIE